MGLELQRGGSESGVCGGFEPCGDAEKALWLITWSGAIPPVSEGRAMSYWIESEAEAV